MWRTAGNHGVSSRSSASPPRTPQHRHALHPNSANASPFIPGTHLPGLGASNLNPNIGTYNAGTSTFAPNYGPGQAIHGYSPNYVPNTGASGHVPTSMHNPGAFGLTPNHDPHHGTFPYPVVQSPVFAPVPSSYDESKVMFETLMQTVAQQSVQLSQLSSTLTDMNEAHKKFAIATQNSLNRMNNMIKAQEKEPPKTNEQRLHEAASPTINFSLKDPNDLKIIMAMKPVQVVAEILKVGGVWKHIRACNLHTRNPRMHELVLTPTSWSAREQIIKASTDGVRKRLRLSIYFQPQQDLYWMLLGGWSMKDKNTLKKLTDKSCPEHKNRCIKEWSSMNNVNIADVDFKNSFYLLWGFSSPKEALKLWATSVYFEGVVGYGV